MTGMTHTVQVFTHRAGQFSRGTPVEKHLYWLVKCRECQMEFGYYNTLDDAWEGADQHEAWAQLLQGEVV